MVALLPSPTNPTLPGCTATGDAEGPGWWLACAEDHPLLCTWGRGRGGGGGGGEGRGAGGGGMEGVVTRMGRGGGDGGDPGLVASPPHGRWGTAVPRSLQTLNAEP